MSQVAIKVEHLSKIYKLGEIGTGTLSQDIERWIRVNLLKLEDPFSNIDTQQGARKHKNEQVYHPDGGSQKQSSHQTLYKQ